VRNTPYYGTMDPVGEARERLNIVSALEEVRGTVEPNRQMLLDVLSSLHAHEQGLGKLYWQYTQQTGNQELKETWQRFGRETETRRKITERTISAIGGDPTYKSSIARDSEKSVDCLSSIESYGTAGDAVRLGNLVMAETVSKANWKGLKSFAGQVKDPATAKILWDASRISGGGEHNEHVTWNMAMYESCFTKLLSGM
jgi:hypothetical protein